jgi:hypothetical protein
MIDLDISSVAKELLGMPNEGLSTNREWRYGTRGSLKVDLTKNTWFDHEHNVGGGTLDLINRSIGGDHFAALKWLDQRNGRPPKPNGNGAAHHALKPRIVATYDYVNEDDELLFQTVRFEPKDFRQRHPDGRGGWIWKLDSTRRVLFKLPQLIEAIASNHPVFIVEGEKDCEALAKLNIVATTNCGGANKWRPNYNAVFSGADVVLIPDNDAAGPRAYAGRRRATCSHRCARVSA